MKKMTHEEIQNSILNILIYLDKICRENNIKYMISSGTCLGAIRHKGFIPWDNDADILMDRENYNKLIEIMQKDNSKYELLSYKTTKNYYYPYYKLVDKSTKIFEKALYKQPDNYGVFIDIFPLDGLPKGEKQRNKFLKKRKVKHDIQCVFILTSKTPLKRFIKKVIRTFSFKSLYKQVKEIDDFCSKNSFNDADYLMDATWGNKYFPRECYDELYEAEFEGHKFFVPKNYDLYLKTIYGDYMKLPPEDKRQIHEIDAYKKDED